MTPPGPTPALARLRAQYPPPGAPRILVHGGTCGMQANAGAILKALRVALPDATIVETACDGACWAAPAATVQRDSHAHRFARLDRGISDELAACLGGQCDDEYAGRGERGLLARLGRTDGSLGDAIARGAYTAFARTSMQHPDDIATTIRVATQSGADALARWSAVVSGADATLTVSAHRGTGTFGARHLLQGDPHRAIEGIAIACRALGINRAAVVFSADEPPSHSTFDAALRDASAILDGTTLGGGSITITTRMANTRPTTGSIEDVEALAALSLAYDSPPPPTRLLSLSGAFARPGLYEVPIDGATTWSGVIAMAGTSPARVPALLVGGPDGAIVRDESFEDALTPDVLADGGILALPFGADVD